jgi:hypothetical protein
MSIPDQYEIKVPPRGSYRRIVWTTWLLTFFATLIPIIIIPLIFGAWQFTLAAGVLVLAFALSIIRWKKYHVTYLRINTEQIEIRYQEKDEEKYITGCPEHFMFSYERWLLSQKGMEYKLTVHYNGKLILQQYPGVGHWTERRINETVSFFNHRFSSPA